MNNVLKWIRQRNTPLLECMFWKHYSYCSIFTDRNENSILLKNQQHSELVGKYEAPFGNQSDWLSKKVTSDKSRSCNNIQCAVDTFPNSMFSWVPVREKKKSNWEKFTKVRFKSVKIESAILTCAYITVIIY